MSCFSWLLICPLLLAAASAHAERIYHLVDYPDLQNGHTLSGTITTTDDAPDDGLLDAEEILAWQWSITGSRTFMQSSELETRRIVDGMSISARGIELPHDEPARFDLRSDNRGGFDGNSFDLSWFAHNNTLAGNFVYRSQLTGIVEGDLYRIFWDTERDSIDGGKHLIATAVPEPNLVVWLGVCILTFRSRLREVC